MHTLRTFALVSVAIGLFGCPNPNTYSSARTLPNDKVQVLVAAEGYAIVDDKDDDDDDVMMETELLPSTPTIGLRYGASDSVDVGLRAVNLSSLAFDTKVQLMRGRVDLALDPAVQWIGGETRFDDQDVSVHFFDLHLPVLLGWNINKRASLVVSPGVMFRTSIIDEVEYQWWGVAGVGLNLRATRSFAVQPQISASWALAEGDAVIVAGLGFTFGGQPSFDDLDTQTTESPSTVARD